MSEDTRTAGASPDGAPSGEPSRDGTEDAPAERAGAVAAVVAAVPTVRLHRGAVATHLAGRRIPGVRLVDGGVEVHVAAVWPTTVIEAAAAVRAAVGTLGLGRVDVVIDDVVLPEEDDEQSPSGSGEEPT